MKTWQWIALGAVAFYLYQQSQRPRLPLYPGIQPTPGVNFDLNRIWSSIFGPAPPIPLDTGQYNVF